MRLVLQYDSIHGFRQGNAEEDLKEKAANGSGSSGSSSSGSKSSGGSGSSSVKSGQETTVLFVLGGVMLAAAGVLFLSRKKREE